MISLFQEWTFSVVEFIQLTGQEGFKGVWIVNESFQILKLMLILESSKELRDFLQIAIVRE